ncbi:CAP domain-containing protein [Deinococcus soli (ex Cha et al. 2016)]|uniref:CAP domain-containing protein n=1 Tax=Deinococcus soli (ex Cha et al. 2016) TaxID=1309411 RepID=UPI00166B2E02|nr:CAP domain-containing protein [Deinococcus soli (ex Cha et al. 2016)]
MTRVMLGAVVGALVLVGCGGGGTPPEENQVRVQVVDGNYGVTFEYLTVPTFTPLRTALAEFPQSVAEGAMLAAINAERARGGVCPTGSFPAARPLQFEAHLHRAATLYGRELVTAGKMELPHRSRVDNRVPSQRMVDAGYRPVPPSRVQWVFGESLAAGTDLTSPAEVIAAWKDSPSHCRALFENIGNGAVARVDGAAGKFWVLNIAGWENE